jgi:demethylmenaquinone methyltransferase/2-methoxy-6-polyprenyl-1,4-benzoquinol methylase
MTNETPKMSAKDPTEIREMFAAIAERYDRLNQLMTFGQHQSWRREVVDRLKLEPGDAVLDIGAGTGDLALEVSSRGKASFVVACDFTMEMLRIGQSREGAQSIDWVLADAHRMPFPQAAFDGVVCGFLLRNLGDLRGGLDEQTRLIKPGGMAVWLDTTLLQSGPLKPVLSFYMDHILPKLAGWLAGDRPAYAYLSQSSANFLSAVRLAERILASGFERVGFAKKMLGAVAIHWGSKPGGSFKA